MFTFVEFIWDGDMNNVFTLFHWLHYNFMYFTNNLHDDGMIIQWNLYKATIKFCVLSRQVVLHDRENKHDLVKAVPGQWRNLRVFSQTSLVSLYKFHCRNTSCMTDSLWGESTGSQLIPLTKGQSCRKGQWCRALMFCLLLASISHWTNSRDMRRHEAQVMLL